MVFEIQVKNSRKLGENIFRYYNLFLSATVWRVTLSITAPPKFRFNHWMQVRWMCIHKYYFPAINSHKNLNLSLSLLCLDTPKLLILWEILIVRYGHEICILSTTRNKYFYTIIREMCVNNHSDIFCHDVTMIQIWADILVIFLHSYWLSTADPTATLFSYSLRTQHNTRHRCVWHRHSHVRLTPEVGLMT